jgi:hypothetical protein
LDGPRARLAGSKVIASWAATVETLCRELGALPFEPFAPVRRQLLNILRAVNRARLSRGFEPVPTAALRLRAMGASARRYARVRRRSAGEKD